MRAVAYNAEFADRIRETLAGRTDVEEKNRQGPSGARERGHALPHH
jgi:hypothetical protein